MVTCTPESLVAAICARGVSTSDLRFAAHEACHALQWGVRKKWTIDNIHARKPRPNRILGDVGVLDEITARAVEQLVCAKLGVDCGSVEHWATVCWMETLVNERILLPKGDWLEQQIRKRMESDRAARLTDQVLALAGAT